MSQTSIIGTGEITYKANKTTENFSETVVTKCTDADDDVQWVSEAYTVSYVKPEAKVCTVQKISSGLDFTIKFPYNSDNNNAKKNHHGLAFDESDCTFTECSLVNSAGDAWAGPMPTPISNGATIEY